MLLYQSRQGAPLKRRKSSSASFPYSGQALECGLWQWPIDRGCRRGWREWSRNPACYRRLRGRRR